MLMLEMAPQALVAVVWRSEALSWALLETAVEVVFQAVLQIAPLLVEVEFVSVEEFW